MWATPSSAAPRRAAQRAEREQRQRAVRVGDGRRPDARGQQADARRDQPVGREPRGAAISQSVGSPLTPGLRQDGALVARDEHAGDAEAIGLGARRALAGEQERRRADLGLDAAARGRGHAHEIGRRRAPRRGVDRVVALLASPHPAPAVAPGRGEAAALERERDPSRRHVDAHGPDAPGRRARGRDVASEAHERGPVGIEPTAQPVGDPALRDAAEIELHAGIELDRGGRHVDAHTPAAASRRRPIGIVLGSHRFEAAVVSRLHQRGQRRRVEAPSRALACGQRDLHELEQLGPCLHAAVAVEARQLRVGAEAREQQLQPEHLALGGDEGEADGWGFGSVDEQLAGRPDCLEAMSDHHDDRVIVSGGSVTMRTGAGPPPKGRTTATTSSCALRERTRAARRRGRRSPGRASRRPGRSDAGAGRGRWRARAGGAPRGSAASGA